MNSVNSVNSIPLAITKFCQKYAWLFARSSPAKTIQNTVYMLSTSWPSVPDSKYQLLKFRCEQKTNFKKLISFLGLTVKVTCSNFTFPFFLLDLYSLTFLALFCFFFFLSALTRKYRLVVEQDSHRTYSSRL